MKVQHLDHLNLSVRDFDETVEWYRRIFDFELVEEGVQDGVRWGVIRGGEAMLCIYEHPKHATPDLDRTFGVSHFGLRIDDPEAWEALAEREGLELLYGGKLDWPHSLAWYVADPTGYEIEICYWKQGKSKFD